MNSIAMLRTIGNEVGLADAFAIQFYNIATSKHRVIGRINVSLRTLATVIMPC